MKLQIGLAAKDPPIWILGYLAKEGHIYFDVKEPLKWDTFRHITVMHSVLESSLWGMQSWIVTQLRCSSFTTTHTLMVAMMPLGATWSVVSCPGTHQRMGGSGIGPSALLLLNSSLSPLCHAHPIVLFTIVGNLPEPLFFPNFWSCNMTLMSGFCCCLLVWHLLTALHFFNVGRAFHSTMLV